MRDHFFRPVDLVIRDRRDVIYISIYHVQHFTLHYYCCIISSYYYCDNHQNNTTTCFLSTHPVHRLSPLNNPIITQEADLTVILKFGSAIVIILLPGAEQTHFTTHFIQMRGTTNSSMLVIKSPTLASSLVGEVEGEGRDDFERTRVDKISLQRVEQTC